MFYVDPGMVVFWRGPEWTGRLFQRAQVLVAAGELARIEMLEGPEVGRTRWVRVGDLRTEQQLVADAARRLGAP